MKKKAKGGHYVDLFSLVSAGARCIRRPQMMTSDVQPSLTGTLEMSSPIGRYILCRWPKERFFCVISAEYASVEAFDIFWSFGQLCERADWLLSLLLSNSSSFTPPPPPTSTPTHTNTHSKDFICVSITTPYPSISWWRPPAYQRIMNKTKQYWQDIFGLKTDYWLLNVKTPPTCKL